MKNVPQYPSLEHKQFFKIAVLPDKSTLYIKRVFTNAQGEYQVTRRLKGDSDENEMILEDNFETIEAAVARAWFYFNMFNK